MPNEHGEKLVSLNFTRIKLVAMEIIVYWSMCNVCRHWLVSGAKPTTAVAQLFGLVS